jgi:hypothetical protein
MVYASSCGCIMVSASAVVSLLRYSRQYAVSSGLLPKTCGTQFACQLASRYRSGLLRSDQDNCSKHASPCSCTPARTGSAAG